MAKFGKGIPTPNKNAPVTNTALSGKRNRMVPRASESARADMVNTRSSEPRQLDAQNKKYNGAKKNA